MSSEQLAARRGHEATADRLSRRNAELENSNRLLLDELAECRRAEVELRGRAGGFPGLMRSKVIGLVFVRTDGTVTAANDTFLRMLGYTREELRAGKLCWSHVCASAEALTVGPEDETFAPAELQFVRKGGERVRLLFAAEHGPSARQVVGFAQSLPS